MAKSTNYIWWALLVLLTLATPIIGTIAASFILILTLLASPFVIGRNELVELKQQPMILMFSISFIVFAFFSTLAAKSANDLLTILAFMPFLASGVAYILAKKYAKIYGGKKTALIFMSLCLLGSGFTILVALYEMKFLGAIRPRGFFSGVITLSMVGTTLGIVAGMGFFISNSYKKIIFMLGPIFAIIIIALTQSRGTAIALPALVFLYSILAIRRTKTIKAKIIVIFILSFLVIIAFYFITQQSGRIAGLGNIISQALTQGLSSIKTANIRIEMYQAGWELFLQKPLIGYGWGNMGEYAVLAMGEGKINGHLLQYFQFHNDFINYAFAIGIVGIIIFFSFLFAPIIGAFKSAKDNMYGIRLEITLLMATLYFFSGLTGGTLSHGLLITLYAMISAIVLGGFQGESLIEKSKT